MADQVPAVLIASAHVKLEPGQAASCFDLQADRQTQLWTLRQARHSVIWPHETWHPMHCTRAKEACSGLGALGLRALRVGIQITCRNEIQAETARVLHLQGSTPVAVGDINANATIKQMLLADEKPAGLLSGFSCQPFFWVIEGVPLTAAPPPLRVP